jgi:hypothetical protein
VACTLADADYYHTTPHLARLSMAESAANDASWMLWPAWPENIRKAASAAIFPEAELLRRNEKLLNNTRPRCDVLLYLCFRRWLETDHCAISTMAASLGQANIQFEVCSEDDFTKDVASRKPVAPVLLIESYSALNGMEKGAIETFKTNGGRVVAGDETNWINQVRRAVEKPSIELRGPSWLRAAVRDQAGRVIVHLYNLDVQRVAPYEDEAHPVQEVGLIVRAPFKRVRSVRALTADENSTQGPLKFTAQPDGDGSVVEMTYPKLEVSTILVVEP